MALVDGPVVVEVPATSANLGPGYDCLGLALELRDRLTASVAGTLSITVDGEGAEEVPTDESHLVVRAVRAGLEFLGEGLPGLTLHCDNVIPHSRGLGSSSAAIVGGLCLARGLVADGVARMDDDALFALANRLEGHPDNVAPATYGGFVVCGQATGGGRTDVWAQRAPIGPEIAAVVFVPADGVATEVARGLLPAEVAHTDAAANTGRAALLVAALAGAPERLLRATEDFLHQRYRASAMPASYALVEDLREAGVPAVISGAGPTVLAFTAPVLPVADTVRALGPDGWRVETLSIATTGVRLTTAG
ncbi:MAG TPA: homoserine kinase [Marmoricola sp.]